MGSGCYDGFYRIGKSFILENGDALNLDTPGNKHKGILIRPLSTTAGRTLDIEFYGTPDGAATNNMITLVFSARSGSYQAPYILPCRVKTLITQNLEFPEQRFMISILN